MSNNFESLFVDMWTKFVAFLPNLLTGFILVIIGWIIGWVIKRIVIQVAMIIRLERFFYWFPLGEGFF